MYTKKKYIQTSQVVPVPYKHVKSCKILKYVEYKYNTKYDG